MPPKRQPAAKGKGPARTTIKSDYLADILQSGLDASSGPSSLSFGQLSRAYGLADPAGPASSLRPCAPLWNEDQPASKQASPEVIVLDDTSDDDGEEHAKDLKTTTRGKLTKGKDDHQCSAGYCSDNPRCLNWLGQDKWEHPRNAVKSFAKRAGLGSNPANERTEVPVGLRNLGATCYANSFLQCWFRDVPFRNGVYSCLPPASGDVEASPLFQLQVLFAFLQSSQQGVYDPEPLVRSLKLDTSEQQDAQEFAKLFTSLLDHEFKKQGQRLSAEGLDPSVGKLVQDQFEGTTTYGTQCSTCKSKSERQETFFELSCNLTNNCKLEKRIEASLDKEYLTGDNQYYCEHCGGMSDAVRTTRLETLPPVLHFSLLRFVFNMKELTRTKSQMAISYPLKLDMGKYLPRDAHGRHQQVWYDLKGVLMHKGKSAHHGHYVAQIHDDAQSKWFLFDDESVTPIDDLNGPDLYDEDGERVAAAPKATKGKGKGKAAAVERDIDGSIIPKSKDAYMLIYTKRADPTSPQQAPLGPPPLAAAKVEELDQKHEKLVAEYKSKAEKVKVDFEKAREAKRSVYRNWDFTNEDEDSVLVSKAELKRWMADGLAVDKKDKSSSPTFNSSDKGKGKGKEKEQDANDMEVEIEVKPSLASISPVIDAAARIAAEVLPAVAGPSSSARKPPSSASKPRNPEMIAYDEAEFDRQMAEQALADKRARGSPVPEAGSATSPTVNGDSSPKLNNDDSGVDLQLDDKILSNVEVLCRHDKADPRRAGQMKRISQVALMNLRDLGVKIEPELMVPRDLCRDCAWSIAAQSFYNRDHPNQVKEFQKQEKDGVEGNQVLISKAWITDWKRNPPKMHLADESRDPAPDEPPFDRDVVCSHGNRNPSSKLCTEIQAEAAQVLSSIFPTWVIIPDDDSLKDCKDCKKQQDQQQQGVSQLGAVLKQENIILKSLPDQMQYKLIRGFILTPNTTGYIIPRSFVKEWTTWSRNKSHKNWVDQRPSMINNDPFMCKHGRLRIDLEKEAESPEEIAVVDQKQWKLLQDNYGAAPQIKIWQEIKGGAYLTSPDVCDECLDEKRKDFSSTKLGIRMLSEDDFDGKDRKIRSSSPDEIVVTSSGSKSKGKGPVPVSKFYGSSSGGMRQSARIAAKPTLQMRKELRYIEMNKGDTVKDLRMKIAEKLSIPTICQRLFYKMQELESDQTVEELGLFTDATLELYEVEQDDLDLTKLDDSIDDSAFKRGKGKGKRARDEGFGGTGLYGWESQENGRKDDSASAAMDVDGTNGTPNDDIEAGDEVEVGSPSSSKRPRRAAASKASSSASGSSSGGAKSSTKSSGSGKKKGAASTKSKKDDMDLDGGDDDQFPCPSCTFLNSADAEKCSICETALDVPAEAMS